MFTLGSLARQLLQRAGYLTLRPPHGVAEDLPTYLRRIRRETKGPLHVVCVDDDTGVQSQLLREFRPEEVWFCSPLELLRQSTPPAPPPGGAQALIISLCLPWADSPAATALWDRPWSAVCLRAQLGSYWRGEVDLAPWLERLEAKAFDLDDVLTRPSLSPLQSPADSVVLAARPRGRHPGPTGPASRRARVTEATTFLSTPIISAAGAQLLTGRGSFGFRAGVFNPGALLEHGKIRLLARGENTFWHQQKADESTYFDAVQPCSLTLDAAAGLLPANPCTWGHVPSLSRWRAEDFRLFRFRNEIFSNHSLISRTDAYAVPASPVVVEDLRCQVAFSRVNFPTAQLDFTGCPEVDSPTRPIEKNWAVMSHGDRLMLIYAVEPFHLLELEDWSQLRFRTLGRTAVSFPFSCPGQTLRNSLNPIDYDEKHWLHVVHRVYPGKQYCFWALLIDKERLQPTFALPRPLARGGQPFPASVLYLCSATATQEAIRFFFGVNDAGCGTAEVPRRTLDAQWRRLGH
jgi:hypothetical protein